MFYYIQKTGLEMFDTSRVYGLASLLDTISSANEEDERIVMEDHATHYRIQGPKIEKPKDLGENKKFLGLFVPSDGWATIFLTITMAPTINIKKESRRKKVLATIGRKTSEIKAALSSELTTILGNYSDIKYVPEISAKNKDGFGTVYQSVDVAAGKGFRRPVRDRYEEGGQVYAPVGDLALACIGGALFIHWFWGDSIVGILPAPQKVIYTNYLEIEKILRKMYLCRASVSTVLAHYAVSLAENMRKRKADQSSYADRYFSLVYNAMTKTGNQWKPVSGGLFPLDFPLSLIEDNPHLSEGILQTWDSLFKGARKGREDIGFSLADLIAYPSLDVLEKHVNIHLRYSLDKELQRRRIFIPRYSGEQMKEVLKHVS